MLVTVPHSPSGTMQDTTPYGASLIAPGTMYDTTMQAARRIARQTIIEHYSLDSMIEQYRRIYEAPGHRH